jgi:hypothetical protein
VIHTDIELLEKAAKADGRKTERIAGKLWIEKCTTEWNPLTDDGDALRLAVKLGFVIDSHGMWVRVGEPYSDALAHEQKGDDPYAATRRAIVRAAAAIGEGM